MTALENAAFAILCKVIREHYNSKDRILSGLMPEIELWTKRYKTQVNDYKKWCDDEERKMLIARR